MKKPPLGRLVTVFGGEGGIRTLDTLLTYTPLAGERLQPLGHFSGLMRRILKRLGCDVNHIRREKNREIALSPTSVWRAV